MKLFYSPGACSIGIHLLLQEIGAPFETQRVMLAEGAQHKPEFLAINPKAKVPALQLDDGRALTEYPAIAWYLGASYPDAGLIPGDALGQAHALEAMDYCVATIHMRGFARLFRTSSFSENPAEQDAIKAQGHDIIASGFAVLDASLADRDYVAGDYSVADGAVYYVSRWGRERVGLTLPPNLEAHYQRMVARPAVRRTLEAEGLPA